MKTILALLVLATAIPAARADGCLPFVTRTCEVCRSSECRWAADSCGRRYSYRVTVITYRSYYSNGASTTFTRSYSA